MKNIFLFVSFVTFNALSPQAQTTDFIIKNSNKGPYVEHKVTPKENFYSIGRLFYVHPKHLAIFNSLDMTKGLNIGQIIKIPLSDTNFNQTTEKGLPVYYITGNSESLYRVSTSNRNVLIDKLRKWNNLSADNVPAGSKLVVGFLVSNESAALAVTNQQKTETPKKNDQAANKQVASVQPSTETPKKKDETAMQVVPEKKAEVTPVKQETKPVPRVSSDQNPNQGYFKTSFEQQVRQQPVTKEQTVTSGIFKTASGWADSKYYLLMDGMEAGTIVKITNPGNNKIIYAKLLGEMSGLKQDAGLNIRISNAAASALDVRETDKFILKLNY